MTVTTNYAVKAGGGITASNPYAKVGLVEGKATIRIVTEATLAVATELTLPADAEVATAVFEVTARAAGLTKVDSVAEVRSATGVSLDAGSAFVVDFGRMVTVAGLFPPRAPIDVLRWNGTAFVPIAGADEGAVAELVTDRLMVEFLKVVSEAAFRDTTVDLPAVPVGLELLVDGTTVWFERQGSSAGLGPPKTTGAGYAVDRTGVIRDAFARTPGGPVRVELRAAIPGLLSLKPVVGHRRVHPVAFPDGAAKALDLAEEGQFAVDLPLPADAKRWAVDQVRLVVRGSVGDDRVQPADGPQLATGLAELALAPERVVLARLPAGLAGRFLTLSGIRLPLLATSGSSELSGLLLTDGGGRPGEPVDGGGLAAVQVGPAGAPVWTTLALPGPMPIDETPLWVELQVTYGALQWGLTGNRPQDPSAPGAELFRRLPGGGVKAFPVFAELGPLFGAVRLIGRPDPNRPIAALELDAGSGSPVAVTPSGTDVSAVIGLPTPVGPSGQTLPLDGTATAAGSVVLSDVQIVYREAAR